MVAHPDDESFGLGAVIDSFVAGGAAVSVLCFTHGEASTLHGVEGDLATLRAAELADAARGLDVLAWTLPTAVSSQLAAEYGAGFVGRNADDIDVVVPVAREHQLDAVTCHPSQAVPGSVLWRRLELLGGLEHLRWL